IGATTLQGIETGILQRHGSLRGEQREQVDHLRVEIVKLLTLEIEYAHDLLADHQWNRQLRLCFRDILYITWIFRDVGRVYRPLQPGSGARQAAIKRYAITVILIGSAQRCPEIKFLLGAVEQQDGPIAQLKAVAQDSQDVVQHLIEIEGGEYRPASVVKDRDL